MPRAIQKKQEPEVKPATTAYVKASLAVKDFIDTKKVEMGMTSAELLDYLLAQELAEFYLRK
jgi:hypothetical protein